MAVPEAHIGGGSAHIERERALETAPASGFRSADYATRGTGKNGAHGVTPRFGHGDESAVRLQNGDAVPAATAQLREISVHERADVRVDERGGGALVFAKLGRNFVRGAKVVVAGKGARGDLLVLRIRIGVQKADGNRLGSGAAQALFQACQFGA